MLSAKEDYDEPEYWFPSSDWRFMFRAFLERLPSQLGVIQDVTELIEDGSYALADPICRSAQESLTQDYPRNEKIIVLTEGSTDAAILKASLDLLYPELADYYSFMDFGSSRAPGGAAALAQTVKAFVGSGIVNRVVALFDNDTAGREALGTLSRIALPSNIRAMTYPSIPLAKEYPSLGPGGLVSLDINGLACSIELFLGRDVLAAKEGLTPAQWTGYNKSLREYQGEILGKDELQRRFWAKAKTCRSGRRRAKGTDWSEMHALLQLLFCAFQ
jgi:hypothetical protein